MNLQQSNPECVRVRVSELKWRENGIACAVLLWVIISFTNYIHRILSYWGNLVYLKYFRWMGFGSLGISSNNELVYHRNYGNINEYDLSA